MFSGQIAFDCPKRPLGEALSAAPPLNPVGVQFRADRGGRLQFFSAQLRVRVEVAPHADHVRFVLGFQLFNIQHSLSRPLS